MADVSCEKCKRAVGYADTLGIYAIPCKHGGSIYWKPRTRDGFDPDLGWLIRQMPTHTGWLSWADAVCALGDWLES